MIVGVVPSSDGRAFGCPAPTVGVAYACPVCEAIEADGEHLANHLAITAIRGDAAHTDWLDEHAPDWADEDPPGLAQRVAPLAEPMDVDGTTHDHGGSPAPQHGQGVARGPDAGAARDVETREVLQSARDLTERMLTAEDEPEDAETDEGDSGDESDS